MKWLLAILGGVAGGVAGGAILSRARARMLRRSGGLIVRIGRGEDAFDKFLFAYDEPGVEPTQAVAGLFGISEEEIVAP